MLSSALQHFSFSPSFFCAVTKVSSVADDPARFEEACHRTLRWLDRCIAANANPDTQNLFGIVQGGLDTAKGGLREVNLAVMVSQDEGACWVSE